ncbi:beta-ketoacyl synthase N-terminal-like domain-containing protein, partial [Nonomuraea sp. NPDC050786]|uniref:type I polyketide synthase n=1 Tax=Nonomuraea sp. NPDC050786 TaxID=3154840 RepID=UPI0033E20477
MDESLDIAVVGMAGRFPGARDLREFWRNLRAGRESVTVFTDEELLADGVSPELLERPDYVRAGAVLDDVDLFDARFFGYSAREAAIVDPQQRLFLECAWQALEDAGALPGERRESVGVFAASSLSTYLLRNLLSHRPIDLSNHGFEMLIANDKDYLANRVSYKLGLDGPAMNIQTACSSSLVAVHVACQALLNNECDLALAGGATVRLPQRRGYLYQEGMILSPDGHCRPFDARAGGTIGGSGVGVVVLKRLADAVADGDHIEAVIKGSAVNNDGAHKVGYTAPGVEGQAKVIAAALGAAGVDPASVTAIEAHGTGTRLGDPIEIAALAKIFTGPPGSVAISSVKANIGHLDSAAGVVSLIKAVLQLKHGELVAGVNFDEPNPEIDFARTPFQVNTALRPWTTTGGPRRIGVSSFGFGGTNAHVVLEEAPEAVPQPSRRPVHVLPLSAMTTTALDKTGADLAAALREAGPAELPDIAYTLQTGRKPFARRRVLVARDLAEAAAALEDGDAGRVAGRTAPDTPKIAFLFPGQGSQYPGMTRELLDAEPVFRHHFDTCVRLFEPWLDLRAMIFPDDGADPAVAAARLESTAVAQPALFAVEYALARTLMSWGITPDAMLGHSVGELVAACLAEVFPLAEAVRLVVARGRLMAERPPGAMLSVALPESRLRELLTSELSLAAVNGPDVCVASGPHDAIEALEKRLAEEDVAGRRLHTSHAFHSAMMDPILPLFAAEVSTVRAGEPRIPFLSNRTGDWITADQAADPEYWAGHIRDTVRYADGATRLAASGEYAFVEVGPGHTLATLTRMAVRNATIVTTLPGAGEPGSAAESLMTAVGRIWLAGAEVDWAALHADRRPRRVSLPGYAFDRRRCWIEPATTVTTTPTAAADGLPEHGADETAEPAAARLELTGLEPRPDLMTEYVAPRDPVEEQIAAIWQELLGVGPIGVHDEFVELGGHSLLATQVVARVKDELGVEIPMRRLVQASTIAALAEVVGEFGGTAGATGRDLPIVAEPDSEHLHEPFPLSEIQQAQWIGRQGAFNLGNVAARIYWEVDRDARDLDRLAAAWNQVIDRHHMLRAVIDRDGTQRILPETPPYEFEVVDLRRHGQERIEEELAGLRARLSHEIKPADQWPLFGITAALLPEGRCRLFLGFDLLMADMGSVRILLRDWRAYFEDPAAELPELRLSFRDYVLAAREVRQSEAYARSLEYWRARVADLPPAPDLPLAMAPSALDRPEFVARSTTIPTDVWEQVKARAAEHGVTPSAVLLAAYAVVVGAWSRSAKFTLNVTTTNRLPVHADVAHLVGGFASFNLMPVDLAAPGGFADLARGIQEQSWEDLDHRHVNGVDVLRELARHRGGTSGAVMPVVFTSTLVDEGERDQGTLVDWLGTLRHEVIQTPQVWMDAGVLETAHGLYVSWPAVEALFPVGVVEEMFEGFCGVLSGLVEVDAWRVLPSVVSEGQRGVVASVNATDGPVPEGLLQDGIVEWALREPGR